MGRPERLSQAAELIAADLIPGQKKAAKFAGVAPKTIQRWKKAGLKCIEIGRVQFYDKNHLLYFKQTEGAVTSPHREREQAATADIKGTKAKLLTLELEIKQGEWIRREEVDRLWLGKVLAVKRALLGQGRKLAPLLRAAGGDMKQLQSIVETDNRQILEKFAAQG